MVLNGIERIETVLHIVLKFQVDRAFSRDKRRAQILGGKWNKKSGLLLTRLV